MDRYDAALMALAVIHIVACPFTKVEESFNVQATHDLLYHRTHLDRYDHFEFPGVVPRTFIGPVVLSTLALPAAYFQQWLGLSKLFTLFVIRLVLACFSIMSICIFRRALTSQTRDKVLGVLILVLVGCQFHLMFYCSRLLPNTFSLILCNFAHCCWLTNRPYLSLALFAFNSAVFRSDCVVFAFPQLLMLLIRGRMKFTRMLVVGALASMASATISACVDSFFWRRLIWPELNVFAFNVIENKSSEWGVSPFHAYLTSFLPKALLSALIFIPFGFLSNVPRWSILKQARIRLNLNSDAIDIGVPALFSVVLYSFLPHKEVRFIFPALLPLNAIAAMGILSVYRSCKSKRSRKLAAIFITIAMATSFLASMLFLYVSKCNYPGGFALQKFHALVDRNVSVHIDNMAAISGVTRFGELDDRSIVYDKTEGLSDAEFLRREFDFLIHESAVKGFETVASIDGFSGFNIGTFPPKIVLSPKLYILKRLSEEQA